MSTKQEESDMALQAEALTYAAVHAVWASSGGDQAAQAAIEMATQRLARVATAVDRERANESRGRAWGVAHERARVVKNLLTRRDGMSDTEFQMAVSMAGYFGRGDHVNGRDEAGGG